MIHVQRRWRRLGLTPLGAAVAAVLGLVGAVAGACVVRGGLWW